MTILTTSLTEIRSFKPCIEGWRNILSAHPHSNKEEMSAPFPLVDCLNSNSIADVCWLLGKRKVEIQICARFAKMCADSVAHLKFSDAAVYAADAATAVAAANVYATANATAAATDAADYAAYVAANAAAIAVYVAGKEQKLKNSSFLRQCINEWEGE